MKYLCFNLGYAIFLFLITCGCVKHVPGPKGEPGTPAPQGNLKMVASNTFSVSSSAWTLENLRYKASISQNSLSSRAIHSGEVELYMLVGNQWWALPYGTGDLFMQASFETEMLHLDYAKIHDGPPAKPEVFTFKLVVYEPA